MVSISKNGCKAPKTAFFMILPVKIGRGRKWGWAWSERFENQNKRNSFLRFILKKHSFKVVEKLLQWLKCVFRHFTCIRKRPKNRRGQSHGFPMELGDEFFFVVSVALKAKSGRVWD